MCPNIRIFMVATGGRHGLVDLAAFKTTDIKLALGAKARSLLFLAWPVKPGITVDAKFSGGGAYATHLSAG
ncbi:hypothetical protein AU488_00200 [Lonsdalea populi]|uniref:Uncharacterized protein n=1 Tax=Lonsdalea populi TaxID=1172565 RepID=A0ABX9EXC2_9GAMM|nr:hypothetical protein AU487_00295 [Lonsdalea populi]RAT28443.1 hypothetical protein AU488_00200 [Lonsdalea populi]RAT38250.1 hypothetical protein AU492_00240 [Lonsdalea populi]RAT66031.1 hypothetical protein AU502_00690 [Lonsdalea populi]RAT68949.1 hypothetical protein AU503_00825 [Lonsdalea populi]